MYLSLDHIVLNVEDCRKMVDFYSRVLELTPLRLEEYRHGEAPFPSVRISPDSIIDFFPKKLWEEPDGPPLGRPNQNHFCLALDQEGFNQIRGRLEEAGVPLEVGPVRRWGAHGSGVSVYFRDPEGNLVELRYYPPDSGNLEPGLVS